MFSNFLKAWLGDFKKGELLKFSLLSTLFFLVIGVYWLMRPLKDVVFGVVVGGNYIPYAKWLSLVIVFPLVLIYSKLVHMFPRQRMFYVLCSIYAFIAIIFAVCFMHSDYGLANTVASPSRLLGWAWYVYVESFGSLIVALFWAFTADITKSESAVDGFRLVSIGGQLGNVVGPLIGFLVIDHFIETPTVEIAKGTAIGGLVIFAALGMMGIMGLVYTLMTRVPKEQLEGYDVKSDGKPKKKPGFLDGLFLLLTTPYLLGIFSIILIYEVIVTIFDFNFKLQTLLTFNNDADAVARYLFMYGVATGVVSLICSILGVSRIQKIIGLGKSLAMLPLIIAVAVFMFMNYPALHVLFGIMVFSKAINYALNKPTEKQLYIPTSKDAKYTSQAFIDTYGSRGAKALGSVVNTTRKTFVASYGAVDGARAFILTSSYISFGLIGVWMVIALWLGATYNTAVKEQKLVC